MSEGIFPDCDCHYTIDDDGIHFCKLHKNAEKTIEDLKARLSAAERVIEEARRFTPDDYIFTFREAGALRDAINFFDQLTQRKED
jgi:hypothetical protein